MPRVGVRELKEQGSRILRDVRETGAEYEITYHGRVIAHLIPASRPSPESSDLDAVWANLDQLAAEISAKWADDVSAADAVAEDRSEL